MDHQDQRTRSGNGDPQPRTIRGSHILEVRVGQHALVPALVGWDRPGHSETRGRELYPSIDVGNQEAALLGHFSHNSVNVYPRAVDCRKVGIVFVEIRASSVPGY